MDRILAALERRFGRFAIPNLTVYVVGFSAFAWVLEMLRPGFLGILTLDLEKVQEGQVWRLVSFLFIPPSTSPIWILFALYFTWMVGSALESHWGSFRFNVFYLLGTLGTIGAAYVFNEGVGNFYLHLSLFLAFATLFPEFQLLLFFILPVKVKWLALVDVIFLANQFLGGSWAVKTAILVGIGNYLLFFYPYLIRGFRTGMVRSKSLSRRAAFAPPPRVVRTCKACGVSDEDPQVDMRVCTCPKCIEPTNYCLEHARNH